MENQVISEVSVIPVGTGDTGISHYIAACLELLDGREDLSYRLTPMGTVIEGSLKTIMEVIRQMHEIPFHKGASRVVTVIKIDDRRDKPSTMAGKIESVLKQHPSVKT